jgi:hypothetical protein
METTEAGTSSGAGGMSPFTPTDPDAVPWVDGNQAPQTEPSPLIWHGQDGTPIEITGQDIAYWVHCWCGMEPLAFIKWLIGELETLDAIDRYCSK